MLLPVRKNILFIDPVCPRPYSKAVLEGTGLGGTEATVIRIAEGLQRHANVTVAQHCRTSAMHAEVTYTPLTKELLKETWHKIIVLRSPAVALGLLKIKPMSKIYLWLHDAINPEILKYGKALGEANVGVICVSNWHKTQLVEMLKTDNDIKQFPMVTRIYNPIDDNLKPDDTVVNPNKLVFFSSPHKGLDHTLKLFKNARAMCPELELYVSNPGYLKLSWERQPGVVDLGVQSHQSIMKHVRQSLCVFYPNYEFPETFGLVVAEANAVGTPVLTHPRAALTEVVNGYWQLTDCHQAKMVLERLFKWQKDRPKVEAKECFRLKQIVSEWKKELDV